MVKILIDAKDTVFSMSVKGHANFASAGQDIVCAAVSVLLTTWAEEVNYLVDHDMATVIHLSLESGNADVIAELHDPKACRHIHPIITGFKLIAESYPEYCELTLGGGLEKVRPLMIN